MNKTAVLVTGGAGYIGSHMCCLLAERGYLPVTLDNLSTGHEWAVRWGPLVKADILDTATLRDILHRYKIDTVMHFAASSLVGESVNNPAKYYHNNIAGTLNLLQCMRDIGVSRLVFSSTCAIFGLPEMLPIHENLAKKPINPYGKSKWMVEQILADYSAAYGLQYTALRYFNAAGAKAEAGIGEAHNPESHLIPLVLQTALGQRPCITIFGDDYDTRDGSCIRDYVHVLDLCEAHLLAMQAMQQGAKSDVFNLGNGQGFSVLEIITAAEQVSGHAIARKIASRRSGDSPTLLGDSSKAREKLLWKPENADITSMIRSAWNWHCRQGV